MTIQSQIEQLKKQLEELERQNNAEKQSSIITSNSIGASYTNYIHPYTGQYVIIRSYGSGCHFGILKSFDPYTGIAFVQSSRRLWYWDKAFTLSEVAINGIGGESKLPPMLEEFMVCNILEIIPATDKAINSIKNWKVTDYGN